MLPILFQSPDFILYSYPLFMGMGWGVAYQLFFHFAPLEIPRRFLMLLYWGIFLFAWLGAKLMFVLTVPNLDIIPLVRGISFWTGGGFVFFGGFIGGLLFFILYRLINFPYNEKIYFPLLASIALGHGIGRVGCFLAGCCYGAPTDWWWGIHLHGSNRHPTQLIEAFGLFILTFYLYRSRLKSSYLKLIGSYMIGYGALRFIVEMLRGDEIRGQWGPFFPSQWISFLLFFVGFFVYFTKVKIRR